MCYSCVRRHADVYHYRVQRDVLVCGSRVHKMSVRVVLVCEISLCLILVREMSVYPEMIVCVAKSPCVSFSSAARRCCASLSCVERCSFVIFVYVCMCRSRVRDVRVCKSHVRRDVRVCHSRVRRYVDHSRA